MVNKIKINIGKMNDISGSISLDQKRGIAENKYDFKQGIPNKIDRFDPSYCDKAKKENTIFCSEQNPSSHFKQ